MASIYPPDQEDVVILNGFSLVSQLSAQQNRPWRLGTRLKGEVKGITVRVLHPENGTAMDIGILLPLERTQLELIQDITDLFDIAEAIWKMWVDTGIASNPIHAASPNFGDEKVVEELDKKVEKALIEARKKMEYAFKNDPRVPLMWDNDETVIMNGAKWEMIAGSQEVPKVVAEYLSELKAMRDRHERGKRLAAGMDLTMQIRGPEQYQASRFTGER